MLLIIDNQSKFIKRFKHEFLAEQDFEYYFIDHNEPLVIPDGRKISGIILSGGKGNPYEPLNLTANFVALINFDVPIMGICLGHEIVAVAYRGRIKKMVKRQNKNQKINILMPEDPIFEGFKKKDISLVERHSFQVSMIPPEFDCLAKSDACDFEIIKHKDKPIYGFQSHPEVSGIDGLKIMNNFLKMCGLL